ncbi:MAG: XRE family transcriptional regulator [Chloroflexi bacterium HGW-Chloroflexi-10]|nr:MAG: XRE family transcriptional regulator [Chloroflexi bacterium HGW-Chloroflexi-10]
MGNAILETNDFIQFLIRAKQNTYAGSGPLTSASRTCSKDLAFEEGDFTYLDTYLGDIHFIGEEAVWHLGQPIWGMNYYGRMLVQTIPLGFSECLKEALLQVPSEIPFRGPEEYRSGDFSYQCAVEGGLEWFRGKEYIAHKGQRIYQLYFHGGEIKKAG